MDLRGSIACVTGASSGIGRAIAIALARQGAHLCLLGRNRVTLAEAVAAAQANSNVTNFRIDFAAELNFEALGQFLQTEGGKLEVLVHSAGVIQQNTLQEARIEDYHVHWKYRDADAGRSLQAGGGPVTIRKN
jgi:NADP-dependent 3-hydroxy acid dehydrogenase YdfG